LIDLSFGTILHGSAGVAAAAVCVRIVFRPNLGRAGNALVVALAALAAAAFAAAAVAGLPESASAGFQAALAATGVAHAAILLTLPALTGLPSMGVYGGLRLTCATAAFLISTGWLLAGNPTLVASSSGAVEFMQLGSWGHFLGLPLLGAGVLEIVSLEQSYRGMEEHERWRRKFPMLALLLLAVSAVFLATRLLLTHTVEATDLALASTTTLVASLLIGAAWSRVQQNSGLRLSQRALVGSLSLVAIGIYLVSAAVFASWLESMQGTPAELAAFLFLLLFAFLAAALLSTEVRHRAQRWVRRNLFEGRFDYRALWLDADEAMGAGATPVEVAAALCDLAGRTVGSLETTTWVLEPQNGSLKVLAVRGDLALKPGESRMPGDRLWFDAARLESGCGRGIDCGDPHLARLLEECQAELYCPLRSADGVVGLLTVGSNRSGQPHDDETRECLRVLAGHAAGEIAQLRLVDGQLQAKEADAFREFAHGVLHDLKNFSSTLSLIAQNARQHGDNPEFQRDAFESVLDTASKMKHLCNSLRFFSSDTEQDLSKLDLSSMTREVAGELGVEAEQSDPLAILGDPDAVRSVVRNLIMNALEATDEGKSVRVRTWGASDRAHLVVEDHGSGIPPEFLEDELFHPFHTTKSDGLGLGLFQTKRHVEAHGGTIEIESTVGHGTRVEVVLPLDRDSQ